jgi:hypothetical protein
MEVGWERFWMEEVTLLTGLTGVTDKRKRLEAGGWVGFEIAAEAVVVFGALDLALAELGAGGQVVFLELGDVGEDGGDGLFGGGGG